MLSIIGGLVLFALIFCGLVHVANLILNAGKVPGKTEGTSNE